MEDEDSKCKGKMVDWKKYKTMHVQGEERREKKATSGTGTGTADVEEDDISFPSAAWRWPKQLISGRGAGSVSLIEKKQRDNNGAAKNLRFTQGLWNEANKLHAAGKVDDQKHFDMITGAWVANRGRHRQRSRSSVGTDG